MLALLEALAFSNLWVGAAAGALLCAASLAMGVAPVGSLVGLAVTGTLVVYGVDRLRDLPRDRETTPVRSRFVESHRQGLTIATGAAALTTTILALAAGPRTLWVLVPVLGVGLFHRRLKRLTYGKVTYITVAWLAVVVGLPAVHAPAADRVPWVVAILGAALLANAIAANVRDREAAAARLGPRIPLRISRGSAALGVLLAAAAPPEVRPLAAVPLLTLLAMLPFRPGERYGLIVVDGALLAGALVAVGAIAGC